MSEKLFLILLKEVPSPSFSLFHFNMSKEGKLPASENKLNYKILQVNDYLVDFNSFSDYCYALLGYSDGLLDKHFSTFTLKNWFNLLQLEPNDDNLITHPTDREEVTCVFNLLDWEAIHTLITTPSTSKKNPCRDFGEHSHITIVDPFCGPTQNICRVLDELLKTNYPSIHSNTTFVNMDKKVSNLDSLNPKHRKIWEADCGPLSARIFVFSAPYRLNDLAICYFAYLKNLMVIAQVQGDFLTRSYVKYRTEGWFKKLWEEERILVVEGGSLTYRDNVGQQTWLFIFSNKYHVTTLFKPSRHYRISGWPIMEQMSKSTVQRHTNKRKSTS